MPWAQNAFVGGHQKTYFATWAAFQPRIATIVTLTGSAKGALFRGVGLPNDHNISDHGEYLKESPVWSWSIVAELCDILVPNNDHTALSKTKRNGLGKSPHKPLPFHSSKMLSTPLWDVSVSYGGHERVVL